MGRSVEKEAEVPGWVGVLEAVAVEVVGAGSEGGCVD